MKTKLRLIAFTSATIICATLSSVHADISVDTKKITQELGSVPKPELAPKAAQLVLTAQGENRTQATEAIVVAAVKLSPDAAPSIVAAVCKLSPDVAALTAVTAAAQEPRHTRAIAKAAASAAPAESVKILKAMCKDQPEAFSVIALAVAEAVPKMDRTILTTVVEAIPALKPFYLRATEVLARENNGNPIVGRYVDQMSRDIALSARTLKTSEQTLVTTGVTPAQQTLLPSPPAPPTPIVRPAFQPLPGTPGEIDRDQTVEISPGGVRYSSP